MQSTMRALLLASALAMTGAGCGGSRNAPTEEVSPDQATILRVDNQGLYDMRIYVWRGGQRIRLGTANMGATSSFTLPRSVVLGMTSIRVLAEPIAGRGTSVSEELTVNPGEEILMRILP